MTPWPERRRPALRSSALAVIGLVLLAGYLLLLKEGALGFDWFAYLAGSRSILAHEGAYGQVLRLGMGQLGSPTAPLYLYPPFLAYILIPATVLPWQLGYLLWSALSVGGIAFALRTLPPSHQLRRRWWILAAFGPAVVGFLLGQVDVLVLAGLIMALGSESEALAGTGLAVAAILKLTPAIFVLELVARRRWRAAVIALMVFLPMAAVGGLAEWRTFGHVLNLLAEQPSVVTLWQVAPASVGGPGLAAVATIGCGLVFIASPLAPPSERPLIRGLALGLALTTFPMNAWAHWLTFGLVALFLDAGSTRLGRWLLGAYLIVGWTIVVVGSVLILGSDLVVLAVMLAIEGRGLWRRLRPPTSAGVPMLSSEA